MDGTTSNLSTRLMMLKESIPTANRRRTARGLMRTCRALTDHLAMVRQLYAIAETAVDREAVDALVDEILHQRGSLSQDGRLAREARKERDNRAARR